MAQTILEYEPASFRGTSPLVYLTSAGSHPIPETRTSDDTTLFLNVHFVVLYGDTEGEVYNERDATDLLDDMDAALRQALADHRRLEDKWQFASYAGRSQ